MCEGCAAVACGIFGITGFARGGVYYSDTKGERIAIRGASSPISFEIDSNGVAFTNRSLSVGNSRHDDVFRAAFLFHLCLRSHRQDQQRGKR